MMTLQGWAMRSSYRVLGQSGWFYGDFFQRSVASQQHGRGLKYTGIYRYLNDPEKSVGQIGLWGLALISNNASVLILALCHTLLDWLLIFWVEEPHLVKLYGPRLRRQSGVMKNLSQLPGMWMINRLLHGHSQSLQLGLHVALDMAAERIIQIIDREAFTIIKMENSILETTQMSQRSVQVGEVFECSPPVKTHELAIVDEHGRMFSRFPLERCDHPDRHRFIVPASLVPWCPGSFRLLALQADRPISRSSPFTVRLGDIHGDAHSYLGVYKILETYLKDDTFDAQRASELLVGLYNLHLTPRTIKRIYRQGSLSRLVLYILDCK